MKIKNPNIADLEAALADGVPIEIMPDGTVKRSRRPRQPRKPLTMRRDLGGEYAGRPTDRQMRALSRLGRFQLGRSILRDHGSAIISFMFG